jgi:Arc/MetJ-type ribon-helix-helix transcriptional regulator
MAMQTIEAINESAVIPYTHNHVPVTNQANYEAVRFNAMKHGILSRLVVLAHECAGEYSDLLDALIEEHRPAGMTEQHLVEELAAIIWRKRRVLMAEGAKINEGLKTAASSSKSVLSSAAPFQRGMSSETTDVRDLLDLTPKDVAESQESAALDLAATQKAAAILRKGGANSYEKARRVLIPESRDWWDEHVEEGSYPANAEGLAEFIRESLEPICYRMEREARFTPAIKAQTLGEGLQAHRLEKLNRYETHLDRKFERTLAMLLKLKSLRCE